MDKSIAWQRNGEEEVNGKKRANNQQTIRIIIYPMTKKTQIKRLKRREKKAHSANKHKW